MTHPRKLILVALSVSALGVPVAPAGAQVVLDPGSPTGKEYQIPLESARRDASGQSGTPSDGSRTAPLFGEGVGDSSSSGSGAGDDGRPQSSGSDGQRGTKHPSDASSGNGQVVDAIRATRPAGATVPQGGFSSAATIAAVALSVLLLGGVIGSIARRRSS